MSDYVDGDMDNPERRRLEAHVEECPECREILETLGVMLVELGGLRRTDGGQVVAEVILAGLRDRLVEQSGEPGGPR